MKRNTSYKNELFTATRLLNAFTVATEDNEITIVLGLSENIYQYAEEELITHIVSVLEPLVNLYFKVYKVELINEAGTTTVYVSVSDSVTNAEVETIAEAFGTTVTEPLVEEESANGFVTHMEFETTELDEYFKVRK